jgi:hypothetical protein
MGDGLGRRDQCVTMVGKDWAYQNHRCPNRAKYGDYCGVHSPEKRKERMAKRDAERGPTRWDIEAAERKRVKALETSHAEVLKAIKWVVEECDLGPMAFRALTQAIERLEVK